MQELALEPDGALDCCAKAAHDLNHTARLRQSVCRGKAETGSWRTPGTLRIGRVSPNLCGETQRNHIAKIRNLRMLRKMKAAFVELPPSLLAVVPAPG